MRHLKHKQYYIDRYDLGTIEECLWWYWHIKDGFKKERNDKDFKKYSDNKFEREVHKVASYTINIIKGERYRRKKGIIQKWMDRDRKIQEKFNNATAPEGVGCKECYSSTKVTSKDILGAYDEDGQVLFMLECTKCKKRQALHEDGTEWHRKFPDCP